MRKVIQEPGFWMMLFGTIIIAMLLFVPNGRCESSVETLIVSHDYGPLTYAIEIRNECNGSGIGFGSTYNLSKTNCETKYYHLIGPTGKGTVLVGITHKLPTAEVLQLMLRRYILTITEGGL